PDTSASRTSGATPSSLFSSASCLFIFPLSNGKGRVLTPAPFLRQDSDDLVTDRGERRGLVFHLQERVGEPPLAQGLTGRIRGEGHSGRTEKAIDRGHDHVRRGGRITPCVQAGVRLRQLVQSGIHEILDGTQGGSGLAHVVTLLHGLARSTRTCLLLDGIPGIAGRTGIRPCYK